MSDIRRLLGRLNPSTCRFDIGRGGVPELTPQDIAAALGMIRDEFAREVVCALWWPDGARLTRDALLRMLALKQRAKIDRQQRAIQLLRLDLHIAQDDLSARRSVTDQMRRAVASIKSDLDATKREAWPLNAEIYPRIRSQALDECARPELCRECGGRGERITGDVLKVCARCKGTGGGQRSDSARAVACGIGCDAYRKTWASVYEWTIEVLRLAERDGLRALAGAVTEPA